MATEKFIVVSQLDHNGRRYKAGKPIDLEEDEALPLVELGVVKPAEAEKAKKADKSPADK